VEFGLATIKAITDFIFVEDKLKKADLIIVPGSSQKQLPKKGKSFSKQALSFSTIKNDFCEVFPSKQNYNYSCDG